MSVDLADHLFNCPAGLECGPCRRLIGDLIAVAEAARPFADQQGFVATLDDYAALRAALAALDAKTGAA